MAPLAPAPLSFKTRGGGGGWGGVSHTRTGPGRPPQGEHGRLDPDLGCVVGVQSQYFLRVGTDSDGLRACSLV